MKINAAHEAGDTNALRDELVALAEAVAAKYGIESGDRLAARFAADRVIAKRATYRPGGGTTAHSTFYSWASTVVRNALKDYRRSLICKQRRAERSPFDREMTKWLREICVKGDNFHEVADARIGFGIVLKRPSNRTEATIYRMRKAGHRYKAIAAKLKISESSARQKWKRFLSATFDEMTKDREARRPVVLMVAARARAREKREAEDEAREDEARARREQEAKRKRESWALNRQSKSLYY